MRFVVPGATACCLVLDACAQLPVVSVNPDGDYRGTTTRFQALRRDCHPSPLLLETVRDGIMFYKWENQYIEVSVLRNGTLSGSLPGVRLTGTHDGTTMQGDVSDGLCGLHFTLKKIGT